MPGADRHGTAPVRGDRLLLVGACVRALAQSALRSPLAGERFEGGIVALDFFGDADLDGLPVQVLSVRRDFGRERSVANLGRVALDLGWMAVAPAGGLENRPGLLRLLARRGPLLGSAPEAIRAVRDPAFLFGWLDTEGFAHARTIHARRVPRDGRRWLLKRRRAAGGGGVRAAAPGDGVPSGWYLQEFLDGRLGSAAFLADGHDAVLLGVSEQLAGGGSRGAPPFRHAGNLVDAADLAAGPEALLDGTGVALARRLVSRLAARFGLVGLAGFDFIAERGRPHLIEVNPRWTASMELIEEARGSSLFDAMLRVDAGENAARVAGSAPSFVVPAGGPAAPAREPGRILGRRVLYAAEPIAAPPPEALEALGARDRPRTGEFIPAGGPVCTLVACAPTRDRTTALLEAKAESVHALLAGLPAWAARPARPDVLMGRGGRSPSDDP